MSDNVQDPWYKRIANAIVEATTFDVEEVEGGWPSVEWLIANHLLSGLAAFDTYQMLGRYVGKVKSNLDHAIAYLQETLDIPVYRHIPKGKKQTVFITTNPRHRDAYSYNYDRLQRRLEINIKAAKRQVELTAPRRIDRLEKAGQEALQIRHVSG